MSGDAAHPCGADGLAGISGATERYARIGRATAMRGEFLMFHRYPGYPGRRPRCQNTAFTLLSFTSVSLRVLCSLRVSVFILVSLSLCPLRPLRFNLPPLLPLSSVNH